MAELNQQSTKPSTRSILSFSYKEIKVILVNAAKQMNFKISNNPSKISVWFPDIHRSDSDIIKLVIDTTNENFGIEE